MDDAHAEQLSTSITRLSDVLRHSLEHFERHDQLATKHDLKELGENIMSKITDAAKAEQTSLDAVNASLDSIVAGIAALDTLITNFQNSPGTLSAEDQAALDAINAASAALETKAAAVSTTPPTPPPAAA